MRPNKILDVLRRNILIFHQAALGDFVVTWPLAMACGRLFPQSRIIYVTSSQKGKLAEQVLGVESVDVESGFSGLWGDVETVPPGARRMIEGAQWVFSFVSDAGGVWVDNVRRISPESSLCTISTQPPEDWTQPIARYIAAQVQSAHPAVGAGVGQMVDSLTRRGFGHRPATPSGVLVHPGSGAERKNWPRDRFVSLCEQVATTGRIVRVILGEVEIEKWGRAAVEAFARVAQVVEPKSLTELARLTCETEAVVANDSGPAHLAGILGVPTLCVFGPTSDARRWRPLGPSVRVIETPSLEALPVEPVRAELDRLITEPDAARSGAAS